MANPVLNDTIFRKNAATFTQSGVMTVKGTMTKAFLLLLMVIAAGAYTWKIFYEATNPASITSWMWGGLIVGFISAMVISFKPNTAPFLSPIYAAAEGLVLGAVSAIYNSAFAETAPNIVSSAVISYICSFEEAITAKDFYHKLGYDYKNGVEELDEEKHYRMEKLK